MTQPDDDSVELDVDRVVVGCLMMHKNYKPLLVVSVVGIKFTFSGNRYVQAECLELGKKHTTPWAFHANSLIRMVIPE